MATKGQTARKEEPPPVQEQATAGENQQATAEGEQQPQQQIVRRPVQEYLRTDFTDAEQKAFGEEIATAFMQKGQLELERKKIIKDIDSDITKLSARINELAQKMNAGHRSGMVKCEVIFNYDTCTKTCVRLDTGEVVWEKALTGEELQQPLPFEAETGETDAARDGEDPDEGGEDPEPGEEDFD